MLQDRLLGMQAIFCLVKSDGLGVVQHAWSNLFSIVGRHWVHKYRLSAGPGKELPVNGVLREISASDLGLGLLAHTGPDVRVDHVGVRDRFLRSSDSNNLRARLRGSLPGQSESRFVQTVALRRRYDEIGAH